MIIGCWNVRGLNQPLKQHGIREFLSKNKVDIMGLLETKLNKSTLERMMVNRLKNWKVIDNFHTHQGGRIAIIWNPQRVDIRMVDCTEQVIHCETLSLCSQEQICISCVYGHNNLAKRRGLWSSIIRIGENSSSPWLCMGDFNNLLRIEEKLNGNTATQYELRDFQDCCEVTGLEDIRSSGFFYTWTNGKVWSKLDRVMAGPNWPHLAKSINVVFSAPGIFSDHASSLIRIEDISCKGNKIFKFLNIWAEHEEFKDVVLKNWRADIRGCEMFKLCKNQKGLKIHLKGLNRRHFSHIKERVERAEEELSTFQSRLHDNPADDVLKCLVSKSKANTTKLKEAELNFYMQRAKVRHIFNADKGSKYFHALMRQKAARNQISSIKLDNGQKSSSMEQVQIAFIEHYKGLMGTKGRRTPIDSSVMADGPKVTQEQSVLLTKDITEEEIHEALFSIGNDKAPGPDGFNSLFYKKMWPQLKDDMIKAVKEFFSTGRILRQINHSLIALIPKFNNAETVGDYRPIACCNVLYKIIAKVLACRMTPLLEEIINPAQTAFIQKRSMMDNIYLVQEIARKYCRKRISPRCMIKVDLLKAYDLVDWSFLEEMLVALRFPARFVGWVMTCVGTASYSVGINGSSFGHFEGRRGLRQGDPLSPFLFVICMEYLSRSLGKLQNSDFNYHPKCDFNGITHLAFADDLIMFARGDYRSVEIMMNHLNEFGACSGLQASLSKSNFFHAGIEGFELEVIHSIVKFEEGNFPFRFLGIPLAARRLTVGQFSPFIDKITEKINGWSGASLSYAGRLELINAVLRGVEGFWLSIFPIPIAVANRIISLCRTFLWGGSKCKRKKPLVAWNHVCLPKQEGGLGILNLIVWNKALMMKNIWNIHAKKDSLWIRWISHFYLKGKSIWEASSSHEDSPLLKSITNLKELMLYREGSRRAAESRMETWAKENDFNIRKVYEYLRPKHPDVRWAQMVWNKDVVPKHSFILWLGIKGKLLTKDKLHLEDEEKLCPLCRQEDESIKHLFFICPWVTPAWDDIKAWLGFHREMNSLASTVKWIRKETKGRGAHARAKRVAVACFVYTIWETRNKLIFEGKRCLTSDICSRVKTHVYRAVLPDNVILE
jgi:hypothetical protein